MQVLLVSFAWVALIVAFIAGYIYLQIRSAMATSGSGGIGAVSSSLGPLIVILLAILIGPIILITAWLLVRGRGM